MSQLTVSAPQLKQIALEIGQGFTSKIFGSGGALNSQVKKIYEESTIKILHKYFSNTFQAEKPRLDFIKVPNNVQELREDLKPNLVKVGEEVNRYIKEAKSHIMKALEKVPGLRENLKPEASLVKYVDGSFLDEFQNEINVSNIQQKTLEALKVYKKAGIGNSYYNVLQKSFQGIISKSQEFEKIWLQMNAQKK